MLRLLGTLMLLAFVVYVCIMVAKQNACNAQRRCLEVEGVNCYVPSHEWMPVMQTPCAFLACAKGQTPPLAKFTLLEKTL